MAGAIVAAVAASACCLVPAALAIVGVSGAGFAARFTPYRAYFLVATGVALAAGFWFAYRPQRDACGCPAPRRRRAARVGLWITAVVVVALAAYPRLGGGIATAGDGAATARAELHLTITGMDCAECTAPIARRIKRIPGVVSATVDFEAGTALVRHDGRDGLTAATLAAVESAGFHAAVRP